MGNKEVSTSRELSRREVELQRDTGQTISTWCGNSLGNRDSCRQETFGEETGKAVLEGKVDEDVEADWTDTDFSRATPES